jgi:hypothetical protein
MKHYESLEWSHAMIGPGIEIAAAKEQAPSESNLVHHCLLRQDYSKQNHVPESGCYLFFALAISVPREKRRAERLTSISRPGQVLSTWPGHHA